MPILQFTSFDETLSLKLHNNNCYFVKHLFFDNFKKLLLNFRVVFQLNQQGNQPGTSVYRLEHF